MDLYGFPCNMAAAQVLYFAAMGPPGGGRNFITPRVWKLNKKTAVSWKKNVGSLVGVFSTTEKLEKQILKHNLLGSNIGATIPRFWLSTVLGIFGLVFADLDEGSQKHLRKEGFSELTCKLSKAERNDLFGKSDGG